VDPFTAPLTRVFICRSDDQEKNPLALGMEEDRRGTAQELGKAVGSREDALVTAFLGQNSMIPDNISYLGTDNLGSRRCVVKPRRVRTVVKFLIFSQRWTTCMHSYPYERFPPPTNKIKQFVSLSRPTNSISKGDVMGKLDGKIALITGGTSGIELATAKRFVLEGAFVFITGRTQSKLVDAAEQIGSSVEGVRGDVSNLNDLDNLYAAISKTKGKLDIIFANAAAAQYATFGSVTEAHFDDTFSGNVKGLFFTVQKALPLPPDDPSVILNASVVGSKGLPNNSVYAATKAAVRSFARTWTTDLKSRHIRVA
jgi:NADP-dependent 3-hydroxy acid dehydrogenase YdfG